MEINKQKFDKIFERFTKNKYIHEAVLYAENTNGEFTYKKGYGKKDIDSPLLMASITKLFTTACILILKEQGKLALEEKVEKYFQKDTLSKLHHYKGKEYSAHLTLADLLCQTSGLPDVFAEGKDNRKKRVIQRDMQFDFAEIIGLTKNLKPHFAPGKRNRAHYADVNFDMLGEIMEQVMGAPLKDVYQQLIFDPLGLKNTYLPIKDDDFYPNVYYKDSALYRPKYIQSCRASGGCITTARELMRFIKGFFGGELFNETIFHEPDVNNRLQATMFPIHYGAGYMRIPMGGLGTLFKGKGEIIGHSGSSGSFAFYYPSHDLFLVGDVNQMVNPALSVRLPMQLAISVES